MVLFYNVATHTCVCFITSRIARRKTPSSTL